MKDQQEIETIVVERLEEIKSIQARNPQAASRGRAQFLSQAVSANKFLRHKGWSSIFRKEQFAMNAIITILVVAGLLFGGGATVNAAQDDLPGEPLYAVKVWSEDLSLQFQNNQEAQINRLMELAQVRTQEMARLANAGEPIPDQTQLRLQQHVQQALQICSNLDDATLDQTLMRLRDQLQERDRDMEQLQLHTQSQNTLQLLSRTRTMLQQRLQLIDEGLLNHEMFRNTVRNGFRFGQSEELTPPSQDGNGQQNGQPTLIPAGPNLEPGGPNTDPSGPNTDPGGNMNGSGSGSGNGNNNDSGGGGNGMGGGGTGGGSGTGSDPGGNGK